MKYSILSIVLGGLILGFGFVMVPSALARELPDADLQNQLTTQVNQQAATEVAEGMADESSTQPTPTPTPQAASPLVINTGNNAAVDNSSSQSSETSVDNDNQADVNQTVNASANTGDNTANRNISIGGNAGNINTGNAGVYSQLETAANTNQSGVYGTCPAAGEADSQIVNSGNNLDADSSSSNNCTTTITNGNGAVINQAVNGQANTGDNQAHGNISIGGSAGQITTGNAQVGTLLVVQANSNVVLVGGRSSNGGPGSGANIYIINTGNNATFNDRRTSNSATTVNNTNSATIAQVAALTANTGDNTSNRNINLNGDAGVIRTGNAVVVTDIEATANHNQTVVANAAQGGDVSSTELTNTGNNVEVDSSEEINSDTTVNNSNTAEVDQVVHVEANTGRNTANRNIAFNGDAGVIETGNAMVVTSLETDVNRNQTVIAGAGASSSGEDTTEVVNTGNNVDVDASTEINDSTTVNNSNTAEVDQEVNAVANTGDNTANGNIGNTSISTGDVTIHTEVITNANNSYTFIIDSNLTGLELFQQFVAAFLGMSWEELVAGYNPQTTSNGDNTSVVNSGNNVTVLAENTQNRQVVVNNTNDATVNQTVNASANTGGNSCTGNIGGCQITTGDATIWTRLIANLNNNFTFIGNVQLPQPETPVVPVDPTPSIPSTPSVLGESVSRDNMVLAAALPNTGGQSMGLLGLGLLLTGAVLTVRLKKATVSA